MRIDVMAVMRGVDPFDALWDRRTTFLLADGEEIDALSLPDLVQSKKTQRDKDWVMLKRLMEAHYFQHRDQAESSQVRFWCEELRTPSLIVELANDHGAEAGAMAARRPLLLFARTEALQALEKALIEEEGVEQERDRAYWAPLRGELEEIRRTRRGPSLLAWRRRAGSGRSSMSDVRIIATFPAFLAYRAKAQNNPLDDKMERVATEWLAREEPECASRSFGPRTSSVQRRHHSRKSPPGGGQLPRRASGGQTSEPPTLTPSNVSGGTAGKRCGERRTAAH